MLLLLLLLNTTYFSYFIIYIYTVLKQSLCINILNSKNMLGNIFANGNEQFHRKLMFSGDIELNPGSAFL